MPHPKSRTVLPSRSSNAEVDLHAELRSGVCQGGGSKLDLLLQLRPRHKAYVTALKPSLMNIKDDHMFCKDQDGHARICIPCKFV